mmetsp:Transcript_88429/g.245532  ORF Transcript_88429/g.245532 Transcript_88429/m.245532 type:complete len:204 (-) Transcript_88429:89-700(-)
MAPHSHHLPGGADLHGDLRRLPADARRPVGRNSGHPGHSVPVREHAHRLPHHSDHKRRVGPGQGLQPNLGRVRPPRGAWPGPDRRPRAVGAPQGPRRGSGELRAGGAALPSHHGGRRRGLLHPQGGNSSCGHRRHAVRLRADRGVARAEDSAGGGGSRDGSRRPQPAGVALQGAASACVTSPASRRRRDGRSAWASALPGVWM